MASIEECRGGFKVRWRDPGGKARSKQCPTKQVALKHLRKVEEAEALGYRWEPPATVAVPTLYDLDAWRTEQGFEPSQVRAICGHW